jgi:hypothetical protein
MEPEAYFRVLEVLLVFSSGINTGLIRNPRLAVPYALAVGRATISANLICGASPVDMGIIWVLFVAPGIGICEGELK